MEQFIQPARPEWEALVRRSLPDDGAVDATVRQILRTVRERGDEGLREIILAVEGRVPDPIQVTETEFDAAEKAVPAPLKEATQEAADRIAAFHTLQKPQEVVWDDGSGIVCRRRFIPVERVGLYVPGGSAPLFSTLLMLAIPAGIAGCRERILCTPAGRDGSIAPAILHAARICGIDTVFKIGGAQAVAALAYGTETVPKADKIFGPGNRYVLKAKQFVSQEGISIDMPAGPSEVMVVADRTACPAFVAADLLSQAEHGPDSQAILVCSDTLFAEAVKTELLRQKSLLPRKTIVEQALSHSRIVILPDRDDQLAFANRYAPEHLILSVQDPEEAAGKITAAGSIFLGNYSPESAGDYASGTNHTLPTAGLAAAWSGLGTESFMHAVTWQHLSEEGLRHLSGTITQMARAEGLDAHAEAVRIRL